MNRDKLQKVLSIAGIGVVVIGAGLMAMTIIKGVVALTTLVVGSMALYFGIPVLAKWAAHSQIAAMIGLVNLNPIPELIDQYKKDAARIEDAKKAVEDLGVETRSYREKLAQFERTDPDKVDDFRQTLVSMVKVYNYQVAKINEAQVELRKFNTEIESAKRVWDMSKAAYRASNALKKFNAPDPMDQIMRQTALDAVSKSKHRALEAMDLSLKLDYDSIDDVKNVPQLADDPTEIIDAKFTTVKETARA